jgi:enamine deaminase RidA (YjgF/YER057c/UK114 family)
MPKSLKFVLAVCSGLVVMGSLTASALEKKSYNYSDWTKGLFAEAVTITGLGTAKAIYLGGIGAEEESGKPGDIRSPKDIAGQCTYSFEKIQRVLERNGAKLDDIVKMTSYLTSPDYIGPYITCRNAAFKAAGAKLPAETLLIINRLAWPNMMLEVDVDALVAQ